MGNVLTRNVLIEYGDFSKSAIMYWLNSKRFSHQLGFTGSAATGKTTLRNLVMTHTEFTSQQIVRSTSGGRWMRHKAAELGFPNIGAFARYNHGHPQDGHDLACDQYAADLALTNYLIYEGRMAHIVTPRGYHVLVTCDDDVAARRRAESEQVTVEKALRDIQDRNDHDRERYDLIYPGWSWTEGQYDFVCRTDNGDTPEQSAAAIITAWQEWKFQQGMHLVTDIMIWP